MSTDREDFLADDHLADLAQDLLDEDRFLATKSLIRLTSCSCGGSPPRAGQPMERPKILNQGRFRVN